MSGRYVLIFVFNGADHVAVHPHFTENLKRTIVTAGTTVYASNRIISAWKAENQLKMIIVNMLNKGLGVNETAELSGLSAEVIKNIADSLSSETDLKNEKE